MEEYVYKETKKYMRENGFSKKKSAKIAKHYVNNISMSLDIQLAVELCWIYDSIKIKEK